MATDRRISVVVPAYNAVRHLGQAFDSILRQTKRPDEIVVVDDCSTDETVGLLRALQRDCPIPVEVVPLPRNSGGPCRPLNVGIERARGQIICILEQDDVMMPRRVEAQTEALDRFPEASLAIGCYNLRNAHDIEELPYVYVRPQFQALQLTEKERGLPSLLISSERAFRGLLRHNFTISNSNFCFPRTTWEAVGGFDESIATVADLDFALRAMLLGPMAITNELTLLYNYCPASLNRSDSRRVGFEGRLVRLRAVGKRPRWGLEYIPLRKMELCTFWCECLKQRQYLALWHCSKAQLISLGLRGLANLRRRMRRAHANIS